MPTRVHGIFRARILEWIAISFSSGSSRPRDQTRVSHIVDLFATAEEKREFLPILSCLTRSDPSYFHLELISRTNRRRQWHPTPVLLPGKSHGQGSLVGCSPWGRYESDTTERLPFHFSLSCIGEGNGNPLQCSCLENLRDRGA